MSDHEKKNLVIFEHMDEDGDSVRVKGPDTEGRYLFTAKDTREDTIHVLLAVEDLQRLAAAITFDAPQTPEQIEEWLA